MVNFSEIILISHKLFAHESIIIKLSSYKKTIVIFINKENVKITNNKNE